MARQSEAMKRLTTGAEEMMARGRRGLALRLVDNVLRLGEYALKNYISPAMDNDCYRAVQTVEIEEVEGKETKKTVEAPGKLAGGLTLDQAGCETKAHETRKDTDYGKDGVTTDDDIEDDPEDVDGQSMSGEKATSYPEKNIAREIISVDERIKLPPSFERAMNMRRICFTTDDQIVKSGELASVEVPKKGCGMVEGNTTGPKIMTEAAESAVDRIVDSVEEGARSRDSDKISRDEKGVAETAAAERTISWADAEGSMKETSASTAEETFVDASDGTLSSSTGTSPVAVRTIPDFDMQAMEKAISERGAQDASSLEYTMNKILSRGECVGAFSYLIEPISRKLCSIADDPYFYDSGSFFVGLRSIRWDAERFDIMKAKIGLTVDNMTDVECGKPITLRHLAADYDANSMEGWAMNEDGQYSLSDCPVSQLNGLLDSCISGKFKRSRASLLYRQVLHKGAEEKVRRSLKNAWVGHNQLRMMRDYEPLLPNKEAAKVQLMNLGQYLTCLAAQYGMALENNLLMLSRGEDFMTQKETITTVGYYHKGAGYGRIRLKPTSEKSFKLHYTVDSYVCTTIIRLVPVCSGESHMSGVDIHIFGEIQLPLYRLMSLFSPSFGSLGIMSIPEDDIRDVQDEAWVYLSGDEDLDAMDKLQNYACANMATIIPAMVFNGVKPNFTNYKAVKIWEICRNAMLDMIAKPSRAFGSEALMRHFLRVVMVGMPMCHVAGNMEEMKKYVVQFALFAALAEDDDLIDDMPKGPRFSETGAIVERHAHGYVAQVLWIANELLGKDGITKVGFKYLPDFVWFNALMKVKPVVRITKLGHWLMHFVNADTDCEIEEKAMMDRARMLGMTDKIEKDQFYGELEDSVLWRLDEMVKKMETMVEAMPGRNQEAALNLLESQAALLCLYENLMQVNVRDNDGSVRAIILKTLIDGINRDTEQGQVQREMYDILHVQEKTDEVLAVGRYAEVNKDDLDGLSVAARVVHYVIEKENRAEAGSKEKRGLELAERAVPERDVKPRAQYIDVLKADNSDSLNNFASGIALTTEMMKEAGVAPQAGGAGDAAIATTEIISQVAAGSQNGLVTATRLESASMVGESVKVTIGGESVLSAHASSTKPELVASGSPANVDIGLTLLDGLIFRGLGMLVFDPKAVIRCISRTLAPGGEGLNMQYAPGTSLIGFKVSVDVKEDKEKTENSVTYEMPIVSWERMKEELRNVLTVIDLKGDDFGLLDTIFLYVTMSPTIVLHIPLVFLKAAVDCSWEAVKWLISKINSVDKWLKPDEGSSNTAKMRNRVTYGLVVLKNFAMLPLLKYKATADAAYGVTSSLAACALMVNFRLSSTVLMFLKDVGKIAKNLMTWNAEGMAEVRSCRATAKSAKVLANLMRLLNNRVRKLAGKDKISGTDRSTVEKVKPESSSRTDRESSEDGRTAGVLGVLASAKSICKTVANGCWNAVSRIFDAITWPLRKIYDFMAKQMRSIKTNAAVVRSRLRGVIAESFNKLVRRKDDDDPDENSPKEGNRNQNGKQDSVGKEKGNDGTKPKKKNRKPARKTRKKKNSASKEVSDGHVETAESDDSDFVGPHTSKVETAHDKNGARIVQTGMPESISGAKQEVMRLAVKAVSFAGNRFLNEERSGKEELANKLRGVPLKQVRSLQQELETMISEESKSRDVSACIAEHWNDLGSNFEIMKPICTAKGHQESVTLAGKRKLIIHKGYDAKMLQKGRCSSLDGVNVNVVDLAECSVVVIPQTAELRLPAVWKKEELKEYLSARERKWKVSKTDFSEISTPISSTGALRGKLSVLTEQGEGSQIMVTAAHAWRYGIDSFTGNLRDYPTVISAASNRSSLFREDMVSEGEFDYTNGRQCVVARNVYKTDSDRYMVVSVDVMNYGGYSGGPVVTSDSEFLGICMMQILYKDDVDVLDGASLLVVCSEFHEPTPVVSGRDLSVSKCEQCNTLREETEGGEPDQTDGNCSQEERKDAKGKSKVGEIEKTEKASLLKWVMSWVRNNSDEDSKHRSASLNQTSALTDACRAVQADEALRKKRNVWTKTMVVEALLDFDSEEAVPRLCSLSREVAKTVMMSLVRKQNCVLIFSEAGAAMAACGILATARAYHFFARTAEQFLKHCNNAKGTHGATCIVLLEDVLCWAVMEKHKMRCEVKNDNEVVMFRPSDAVDAELTTNALRVLMIYVDKIKVVSYGGKTADECKLSTKDGSTCLDTATVKKKPSQNAGHIITVSHENEVTRHLRDNRVEGSGNEIPVTAAVFAFGATYAELDRIAKRTAKQINREHHQVLACNISSIGLAETWEVVKGCDIICWCTETNANAIGGVVPEFRHSRSPSEETISALIESFKFAGYMNSNHAIEDMRMYDARAIHDLAKPYERNCKLLEISTRGVTKPIEFTEQQLRTKIESIIIGGAAAMNTANEFSESLAKVILDSETRMMVVTQNDVLTKAAIENKEKNVSLRSRFKALVASMRSSICAAVFRVKTAACKFKRRISNAIKDTVRCVRNSISRRVKILKRFVRRQFFRARNKTWQTSYREKESGNETWISCIVRGIGVGLAASSVKRMGSMETSTDDRKRNLVAVGSLWIMTESMLLSSSGRLRNVLITAANVVSGLTISLIGSSAVSNQKMQVSVGGVVLDSKTDAVRELIVDVGHKLKTLSDAGQACIRLEQTAEIVRVTQDLSLTGCLFYVSKLISAATELIYSAVFEWELSGVLSNLWKGIKSRNDSSRSATGVITTVPCIGYAEQISGMILTLAGTSAAVILAKRRAANNAAAIGVLADKKHAADVIEVYMNDRTSYVRANRLISLSSGLSLMLLGSSGTANKVGAATLALLAIDMMTTEKSAVGVTHSLASIMPRAAWSDSKLTLISSALVDWLMGRNNAGIGLNALVLTSGNSEDKDQFWDLDACTSRALKEQNTEKLMNAVLTDFSIDSTEAAVICNEMNGKSNNDAREMFNLERWDVDRTHFEDIVDFRRLTRKEEMTERSSNRGEEPIRTFERITKNQCRYLGRTRKLLVKPEDGNKDDYSSQQASVLFLGDGLWDGVIDDEHREGYGPAGDSRMAVLLAIAERNDSRPVFDVAAKRIKMCLKALEEITGLILRTEIKATMADRAMDWWSIISVVNEKATTGIITRRRSGQALSAGYLAIFGDRCEITKEMIVDGSDSGETHVINVFAKRRVEKKKLCNITGDECVVTRTIQANEIDVKMAVAEAFLVTDKLLKISRHKTGVCIGLNMFCEYAEDDLNSLIRSWKEVKQSKEVWRISLDHSSYDSSQRNWSIETVNIMREKMISGLCDSKNASKMKSYLKRCYKRLKFRTMLTAFGDMFAVTGQQMSGHATTSSDNSLKAFMYARCAGEELASTAGIEIIKGSLKVQGDDTKFDAVVPNWLDEDDVKEEVSLAMKRLGQNVKTAKIKITNWDRGCDFLSHWCEVKLYRIRAAAESWIEPHWVPTRNKDDILAMSGTTLKQNVSGLSEKRKKEVALLAAKAVSFAILYGSDFFCAMLSSTICWGCSKVLSCMGAVNENAKIKASWLPWLAAQSGIIGDYALDFHKILSMHGICRIRENEKAESWVTLLTDRERKMINRVKTLQRNFEREFRRVDNWEWSRFNEAFRIEENGRRTGVYEASISKVTRLMTEACASRVSVVPETVAFRPYAELRRRVINEAEEEISYINSGVNIVYVRGCGVAEDVSVAVVENENDGCRLSGRKINTLTSDGVIVKALTAMQCELASGEKVWLVDEVEKALLLEPSSWHIRHVVMGPEKSRAEATMRNVNVNRTESGIEYVSERAARRLPRACDRQDLLEDRISKIFMDCLWLRRNMMIGDESPYQKLVILK